MIEFITQNWLVFAIALLLGLITAWWVWARRGHGTDSDTGALDDNRDINASTDWLPDDGKTGEPLDGSAEAGAAAVAAHGTPVATSAQPEAPVKAPPVAVGNTEPAVAAFKGPVETAEGKPNIAPAVGEPDNLRQIKGVGPKLNTLLGTLGVTRFDQIAAWGPSEIAEVDGYLGNFKGRIERDNWVDQAGYLATNDIKGFEAKYGAL